MKLNCMSYWPRFWLFNLPHPLIHLILWTFLPFLLLIQCWFILWIVEHSFFSVPPEGLPSVEKKKNGIHHFTEHKLGETFSSIEFRSSDLLTPIHRHSSNIFKRICVVVCVFLLNFQYFATVGKHCTLFQLQLGDWSGICVCRVECFVCAKKQKFWKKTKYRI